MQSFINIPDNSDFSLHNIPFGIFQKQSYVGAATRIGNTVIDLHQCHSSGLLEGISLPDNIFTDNSLNGFIRLGKKITSAVRLRIQEVFKVGGKAEKHVDRICHDMETVRMHLPVEIGNYTDFYSSKEHATNVGMLFRDPENALLPNWLHMPIGYHGRASSIVVSGTDIRRPNGQTLPPNAERPIFGPSRLLDFELEMGFIVGKDSDLGEPIETSKAEDYIFGLVLFNDWSARDIQKWEYVPLGPFLGKNFASTLSPWIVTMEALDPFRVPCPPREKDILPYLHTEGNHNYDIELTVDIINPEGDHLTVSKSNFKYMYWSMVQQLAHHTVNGCNVEVGDLYASGTISGKTPDSYGSMLEITWRGTKPVKMPDGTERKFINDGDTVVLRGQGISADGIRVGFGECSGTILP